MPRILALALSALLLGACGPKAAVPGTCPQGYGTIELQLTQAAWFDGNRLAQLRSDARAALREVHIAFSSAQPTSGTLSIQVQDKSRYGEAKTIMDGLNTNHLFDIAEQGGDTLIVTPSSSNVVQLRGDLLDRTIAVIRKRGDSMGAGDLAISPEGTDRIRIVLQDASKAQALAALLGIPGQLSFNLVDETDSSNLDAMRKGIVPIGSALLAVDHPLEGQPAQIAVYKQVLVSGDRLTDAHQAYDPQTQSADIAFTFDALGAQQFGEATAANVGSRFAIVIDGRVVSAPVIQSPIRGGSGIITGNFTPDSADALARVLNSGAMPAPLKVVETGRCPVK
ncbi:MAG TPA: hypothetical protein VGG48_06655 [Rhizomicrobium sp.]|jgi:protein-export membrane protein SecD